MLSVDGKSTARASPQLFIQHCPRDGVYYHATDLDIMSTRSISTFHTAEYGVDLPKNLTPLRQRCMRRKESHAARARRYT